ncbi:hypothetical protein ACFWTE_23045 [Nocardiopsis sp. NPDC058631]|uniref:hypothetical protein n=1 Tax=Nocardiopsis sp. NPDC058631 TaxID=3346566 RepID=UPI003647794C
MEHPSGRHRRPRRTPAGRVWVLVAALIAVALSFVLVPHQEQRQRPTTRVPRRPAAGPPRTTVRPDPATQGPQRPGSGYHRFEPGTRVDAPNAPDTWPDPDELAETLVRPYLPPLPPAHLLAIRPRIPRQRTPAIPAPRPAEDPGGLTPVARVHLDTVGQGWHPNASTRAVWTSVMALPPGTSGAGKPCCAGAFR